MREPRSQRTSSRSTSARGRATSGSAKPSSSPRPLLEEGFELVADEETRFEVELTQVTESEPPGAARRSQFAVVFSGPADPTLPQRIYGLEHPKLGSFSLFLVPIAAGRYEAVFT